MTALEEIKKALEELREDMGVAYDKGDSRISNIIVWCDAMNAISPTIESLQRENERLSGLIRDNGTPRFNAVCDRAEAAEAEVKRYRVALIAAKTRMRNCRGAIESNQVVDKDVHGSLQNGIRDIETALASTGGEHNAE